MFAGVIDKDKGLPWGDTGMTSKIWRSIKIVSVPIKNLVATQSGVYFKALMSDDQSVSGDDYPHVILYKNTYYLEDGHHRVVKAALKGHEMIQVRVLAL